MKKIIFGIFTLALFTFFIVKANSSRRTITADHLVQPATDQFVQLEGDPEFSSCQSTATRNCVYDVTAAGKANIPDQPTYSATEIDNYVSQGWLQADPNSSPALYVE
ncbi:hypothetical protein RYH73_11020 [Olivibacter sp. CPCC 100613]|uniref:hypothetical protein n=1 Tax=Olivibacter sp. CPCC 100613 TaxID=3079931 RepID=UPI002FF48A3A